MTNFFYVAYYDVASRHMTPVYHGDWDVSVLALSSDDRYLAMVINRDGYGDLKVMDTKTGDFIATPLPQRVLSILMRDGMVTQWT